MVLRKPEADPAIWGRASRIARVTMGAKVHPIPRPETTSGMVRSHDVSDRDRARTTSAMPSAKHVLPNIRMYFPLILSDSRPANPAVKRDVADIGISVSPAWTAVKPSTDCRKIVNGRKTPKIAYDTDADTTFATEKLRSEKRASGSSGSRLPRSKATNVTRRTSEYTSRL